MTGTCGKNPCSGKEKKKKNWGATQRKPGGNEGRGVKKFHRARGTGIRRA